MKIAFNHELQRVCRRLQGQIAELYIYMRKLEEQGEQTQDKIGGESQQVQDQSGGQTEQMRAQSGDDRDQLDSEIEQVQSPSEESWQIPATWTSHVSTAND